MWPYAPSEQYTRRGFAARTASGPSPSSSARPGRRLWRKTSARAASRSSASRPRGSRSDRPRERFPALAERNIVPSPSQNGGPHARPSSPVSGRSTLTTSAPSAARIWAQYGPAIDVVTSSTRAPSSGLCTASSHRVCDDAAAVFDQFNDWVSGEWWSYAAIFAVVGDRRVLPPRPERERRHHRRHTSPRRGDLWLPGRHPLARAPAPSSATTSPTALGSVGRRAHRQATSSAARSRARLRLGRAPARGARLLHHHHRALHPRRAHRGDVRLRLHPRDAVAPLHRRRRLRRAPLGDATPRCSATSAARPSRTRPGRACSSGSSSRSASPVGVEVVRWYLAATEARGRRRDGARGRRLAVSRFRRFRRFRARARVSRARSTTLRRGG